MINYAQNLAELRARLDELESILTTHREEAYPYGNSCLVVPLSPQLQPDGGPMVVRVDGISAFEFSFSCGNCRLTGRLMVSFLLERRTLE